MAATPAHRTCHTPAFIAPEFLPHSYSEYAPQVWNNVAHTKCVASTGVLRSSSYAILSSRKNSTQSSGGKFQITFANLPEATKARFENPGSNYSIGWSHGKEVLEAGHPDFAKGSFYAYICHDAPFEDDDPDDPAAEKQPGLMYPNIWPDDVADGVSDFSKEFKALGQAVVRVGMLLARQCDKYVEGIHLGYEPGKLERIVSSSRGHTGRLLHYFPRDRREAEVCDRIGMARTSSGPSPLGEPLKANRSSAGTNCIRLGRSNDDKDSFSDWCGWHHDRSSLTGLVPGMFLDKAGEEVENVDPTSGLFIRSRQGYLIQAKLPAGESASTCLFFQIGETTQVHSGGALQATPHAVRGTSQAGFSREVFAVFMQPEWGESMDVPRGTDRSSVRSLHAERLLPRGAAPLASRLRPGMNFGEFTVATLAAFNSDNQEAASTATA